MAETITLDVTGMTCGGCENAVKRALSQVDGVSDVRPSHQARTVHLTYDPSKVDLAAVKSRIRALGYQVG